ncbi:MAG: NUDIX hydrolase [Lentisphaeria bacterium]
MMHQRPKRLQEKELATGAWLRLVELEYAGHDGRVRTWEAAGRLRNRGAVVVIPRFVPGGDYLFVQQYRPPADAFILEFPAGLVDPGETPDAAALRELREETGYHGRLTWSGADGLSSPGMSADRLWLVFAEIDAAAPENRQPVTHWDESEHLEILRVPEAGLAAFFRERQQADVILDSRLTAYFLGTGLRW